MTFEEYTRHIDWSLTSAGGGHARQRARQASTMRGAPPHGIRVNVVATQLLDTPANQAMFPGRGDG